MARFSTVYSLPNTQGALDFVDVELSTDTPLYICPYAIQIRDDEWASHATDHIRSFFAEVLEALRENNEQRVIHLLSNLHEPNETRLGQSRGESNGRAIGPIKAKQLADAIRTSRAFETGILGDISETALYVRNIGPDTISDLSTNILRGMLEKYTLQQCEIYEIEVRPARTIGPVWNIHSRDWEARVLELPIHNGKPVLLVPKDCVRFSLSLDTQEFYNHHMVEFLRQEYIQAGGALVQILKDGTRRVTKKSVKERHPLIKDELAVFILQHPEVLERYKLLKGASGPLEMDELEKFFDEPAFAQVLRERLDQVPTGNASAGEYHSLIMGILTFLFYPSLLRPVKEHEIHEGRKRIDIKFTNAAKHGFFHRVMEAPQTRSMQVPVECKNYSRDIDNPALDQLLGRFSPRRGFFGMLLCRSIQDRDLMRARCRDTAIDGERYILVFDDDDIKLLLQYVIEGRRPMINTFMQGRFDELTV